LFAILKGTTKKAQLTSAILPLMQSVDLLARTLRLAFSESFAGAEGARIQKGAGAHPVPECHADKKVTELMRV
jgi:hypothetical protein